MANSNNEDARFYRYILDPQMRAREKKYFIMYLIIGIAFLLFVVSMYGNFPKGFLWGIPVIAILCWLIIGVHYILFIVFGGAWVVDLKNNTDEQK